MPDLAIQEFLAERRALWLKSKIKSNTPEDKKVMLEQEANEKFSLAHWLPDAAKRAGQLSMVSHPAKFSHPNAKTTAIIAEADFNEDGLVRSGNVIAELDVLGNAAALDVHKFLSLKLQDGQTVLQHLEQGTDTIRAQFSIPTASYKEIADGLLAIKQGNEQAKTHGSVKQIYFPVDNAYHLLSVLTPSGILYELKKRINQMRFSDEAKAAREARRENKPGQDYSEVFDLTLIGFGGTKPQNISVLNNQNGGVAYLLNAAPPVLGGRRINPPRIDFFDFNYTRPSAYRTLFEDFHKTLTLAINNKGIRNRIQGLAKAIFFELIDRSWQIRYLAPGWSNSDRYRGLPKYQKLWLDGRQYRHSEEKGEQWLDQLEEAMVRWFINGYEKVIGKQQALPLSDFEFIELKKWLQSCGEDLK